MPGRGRPKKTTGRALRTPQQQYFPSRRNTVSSKKQQPTATSTTRQQTLTQIDFVSRVAPADEDFDLEYLEPESAGDRLEGDGIEERDEAKQNIGVTTGGKGRTSAVSSDAHGTPTMTPQSGQRDVKVTATKKRKTRSTIHTPSLEDKSLLNGLFDDTQADQDYVLGSKKKKRKTIPQIESGPTVQTRSAAKRRALAVQQKEDTAVRAASDAPKGVANNAFTLATFSNPTALPKTPQTSRRKEIPSSATTAEEPLSTHSRVSGRFESRSPLVGLSTNAIRMSNWRKRLEVQDSYDQEADNKSSTQFNLRPTTEGPVAGMSSVKTGESISDSHTSTTANERNSHLGSRASIHKPFSNRRSLRNKGEANDTAKEEGKEDEAYGIKDEAKEESKKLENISEGQKDGEYDRDDFNVGPETQAAFVQVSSSLDEDALFEPIEIPVRKDLVARPVTVFKHRSSSSTPKASQPTTLPFKRSVSDEVSAQLEIELQRHTQIASQKALTGQPPLQIQTASQLEQEFHTFAGPSIVPTPDPLSSPVLNFPHIQSHFRRREAQTPSQYNRRQMLDFDFAMPPIPTPRKDAVPPSQATTADVTQLSSQPTAHEPSPTRRPILDLSSPPKLPSVIPNTSDARQSSRQRPLTCEPSSSPAFESAPSPNTNELDIGLKREEEEEGIDEDRIRDMEEEADIILPDSQHSHASELGINRLTESQLLPESLMRDSGFRAPVWGESDYRRVWDDEDYMEEMVEESVEGEGG